MIRNHRGIDIVVTLLCWCCLPLVPSQQNLHHNCEESKTFALGDGICYCNINQANEGDFSYSRYWKQLNSSITFGPVDLKAPGTVSVQFTLPEASLCQHDKYHIQTFVWSDSQKNCTSRTDDYRLHSELHYHAVKIPENVTSEKMCSSLAQVTFHYLYTSCYQVEISPIVGSSRRRKALSAPVFVDTNCNKQQMEEKFPSLTIAHHQDEQRVKFYTNFDVDEMIVYGSQSVDDSITTTKKSCKWKEDNIKYYATCCNEIFYPFGLQVHNKSWCNVSLPPGNYCASIVVNDERKHIVDLWPPRIWLVSYSFEVKEKNEDPGNFKLHTDEGQHNFIFSILGSLSCLSLMCLLAYEITRKLRSLRVNISLEGVELGKIDANRPMLQEKILLLYARDCKLFMDLMSCFRELLQKYCESEVVDCYADMYKREMNMSKPDWLLSHLKHKHVKVVLVDTDCASLHEEAQRTFHPRLRYCDPDPADELFPLALSAIKGDILICDQYTKFVRVKLSNFKSAAEGNNRDGTLSFLTPYTQYKMPEHFIKLVCSLRRCTSLDDVVICDSDLSELSTKMEALVQYKRTNPSYLNRILN